MGSLVCAVVGVGPGLGLAIARRFGREGFRVAMLARRIDALKGWQEELAAAGITAEPFAADAADTGSLTRAFAEVRERLGDPAVLVYNAAVMQRGLPSAIDAETLVRDFRVNVAGALTSANAVLPAMRANRRGTILFTGGGLALDPAPMVASLSIGKAAIRSLAVSYAKELADDVIHVATVTVGGFVKPGTHFDPDRIADAYWDLYTQPKERWEREIIYR